MIIKCHLTSWARHCLRMSPVFSYSGYTIPQSKCYFYGHCTGVGELNNRQSPLANSRGTQSPVPFCAAKLGHSLMETDMCVRYHRRFQNHFPFLAPPILDSRMRRMECMPRSFHCCLHSLITALKCHKHSGALYGI